MALMSSVQFVLSALLQLPFQDGRGKTVRGTMEGRIDMRKRVPMDLGMILSFPCRNMSCKTAEAALWKKK